MLGFAMVGALSGPPDSMTRTCPPDADNSAARTEPAAPAPTTMKSYRLSSFDSLIILNTQDLKSDFFDSRLEGPSPLANRPTLRDSSSLLPVNSRGRLDFLRPQLLFPRDRYGSVSGPRF